MESVFVGLHKHRVGVIFVSDQFDLVTLLRHGYKHIAVVRVTAEHLPYGVAEAEVAEVYVGDALCIKVPVVRIEVQHNTAILSTRFFSSDRLIDSCLRFNPFGSTRSALIEISVRAGEYKDKKNRTNDIDCCLYYYPIEKVVVIKSYHPTNLGKKGGKRTIYERVMRPFHKLMKDYPDIII